MLKLYCINIPLVVTAASLSTSHSHLQVKRTNNGAENAVTLNKNDVRLSLLWGESSEQDEMRLLNNFARLLGGSHSYSHSSDDDDDDDDYGDSDDNDYAPVNGYNDGENGEYDEDGVGENISASTKESFNIVADPTLSVNAADTGDMNMEISLPETIVTPLPTASPTPSPTPSPTEVSVDSSTSELTAETVTEEATETTAKDPNSDFKSKTLRYCTANSAKEGTGNDSTIFLTEVLFTYALELKALQSDFSVAPLEEAVLDSVASALKCDSSSRKLRQGSEVSPVVLIDSAPEDTPSTKFECKPEINSSNACQIMDGKMIIGFRSDDDKSTAVHDTLTTIKNVMDDVSFVSKIDEVEGVRYLGPDPEDSILLAQSSNNAAAQSTVSVPGVAAGSAGAVLAALIAGLCCLKYKLKKDKEQLDEKFNDVRGMSSRELSNVSIDADKRDIERDTDSDRSETSSNNERQI